MDSTPDLHQPLDSRYFYSSDLHSHLARAELRQAIRAKRDWIFAGIPELYLLIERLHLLKHASCDDDCKGVLTLGSLPYRPSLILLPRDAVSYEDLGEVFGEMPDSEAELAAKDFVCITRVNPGPFREAIDRYLAVDPMSN
jgi:hypothetical protein